MNYEESKKEVEKAGSQLSEIVKGFATVFPPVRMEVSDDGKKWYKRIVLTFTLDCKYPFGCKGLGYKYARAIEKKETRYMTSDELFGKTLVMSTTRSKMIVFDLFEGRILYYDNDLWKYYPVEYFHENGWKLYENDEEKSLLVEVEK